MDNLILLILLFIPKLGPVKIRKLMGELNNTSQREIIDYLIRENIIANRDDFYTAEKLAEKANMQHKKDNILTINFNDNKYPQSLKLLKSPPILLFYKGNIEQFSFDKNSNYRYNQTY